MNKQQFLAELRASLKGLKKREIKERLAFYAEMIDDRREDGLREEDAVSEIGAVEEIAAQIKAESEMSKPFFRQLAFRRCGGEGKSTGRNRLLLVLGAPIWIPLLIAAFAVALALYVSLWAVVVSLWAADLALLLSGASGAAFGIGYYLYFREVSDVAIIGAGLVSVGLSALLFFACLSATRGTVRLTARLLSRFRKSYY